jgi:hypothetical protein
MVITRFAAAADTKTVCRHQHILSLFLSFFGTYIDLDIMKLTTAATFLAAVSGALHLPLLQKLEREDIP